MHEGYVILLWRKALPDWLEWSGVAQVSLTRNKSHVHLSQLEWADFGDVKDECQAVTWPLGADRITITSLTVAPKLSWVQPESSPEVPTHYGVQSI